MKPDPTPIIAQSELEHLARLHTNALSDRAIALAHYVAGFKWNEAAQVCIAMQKTAGELGGVVDQLMAFSPIESEGFADYERKVAQAHKDREAAKV